MRRHVIAARFAIACGVIRVFARCGDVVAAGRFRGRVRNGTERNGVKFANL